MTTEETLKIDIEDLETANFGDPSDQNPWNERLYKLSLGLIIFIVFQIFILFIGMIYILISDADTVVCSSDIPLLFFATIFVLCIIAKILFPILKRNQKPKRLLIVRIYTHLGLLIVIVMLSLFFRFNNQFNYTIAAQSNTKAYGCMNGKIRVIVFGAQPANVSSILQTPDEFCPPSIFTKFLNLGCFLKVNSTLVDSYVYDITQPDTEYLNLCNRNTYTGIVNYIIIILSMCYIVFLIAFLVMFEGILQGGYCFRICKCLRRSEEYKLVREVIIAEDSSTPEEEGLDV